MTNFYNLDESMQKKAIDTVRNDDSYINLVEELIDDNITNDTFLTFHSKSIVPIYVLDDDSRDTIKYQGKMSNNSLKQCGFDFDNVLSVFIDGDSVILDFTYDNKNSEEQKEFSEWFLSKSKEIYDKNHKLYKDMMSDESITEFIETQEILFAEDGSYLLGKMYWNFNHRAMYNTLLFLFTFLIKWCILYLDICDKKKESWCVLNSLMKAHDKKIAVMEKLCGRMI